MNKFKNLLTLFPGLLILLLPVVTVGAVSNEGGKETIRIKMETTRGEVILALLPQKAPITVENFLSYVDAGAYDNTIFHRVIAGFMAQAGGYTPELEEREANAPIHNEADNGLKNLKGTIAMARMGEIDSARQQFFINLADNAHLDHRPDSCTREDMQKQAEARKRGLYKPLGCKSFGYAVFGRVVEGMEVVEKIGRVETGQVGRFPNMPVKPIVIRSMERLDR